MNSSKLKRRNDPQDNWLETEDEYIDRVKKLLPNFPEEVIEIWFCEHNSQVEGFAKYPLEKLKFELTIFSTNDLPLENNGADFKVAKNIEQLRNSKYQKNMKSNNWPMQRIKDYIFDNGTWPRPIIMLDNKDYLYPEHEGYPSGRPYHLMEGYRRVAVLKFYRNDANLNAIHKAWVCRAN